MGTSDTTESLSMRELAMHVRREREAFGLTQSEVAARRGVSQQLYAGIELGSRGLQVHAVGTYGDSVVIGAIRYLLTQLSEIRYEIVRAADERMCVESMTTLASLMRTSSQVCAVISEAIEDGEVDDAELDKADRVLAELEEKVHRTRRDIAVKKEMRRRAGAELSKLAKCASAAPIPAKIAR